MLKPLNSFAMGIMMQLSQLTAISPLDGRYGDKTQHLRSIVSEYGLIFYRLQIEIQWLLALTENEQLPEIQPLTFDERNTLNQLLSQFNEQDALRIKTLENQTNHDVKAIEYYLREHFEAHTTLKRLSAFIHFACTSEDINNLAYALMIKQARDSVLAPALQKLIAAMDQFAHDTAEIPMLSRTHGQPATPTTMGKEFKNFAMRLSAQMQHWMAVPIAGKCNGAVGNFNAHVAAFPQVDWLSLSKNMVESLGLQWSEYTTQIEPHDFLAQWLNALSVCHTILIDFSRDMWSYIALRYFTQKKADNEVGSSTMPHKINPIAFENAEGNLGVSIAMATHLSQKLPISRWQRDLTDSTVLRNLGGIFGYATVAYQSLLQGLQTLQSNPAVLLEELHQHWEILAEPIQTVMRKYHIHDAYEQLKTLTRGTNITRSQLHQWIDTLAIPLDAKAQLKLITPENYVGLAVALAKRRLCP